MAEGGQSQIDENLLIDFEREFGAEFPVDPELSAIVEQVIAERDFEFGKSALEVCFPGVALNDGDGNNDEIMNHQQRERTHGGQVPSS